MNESTVRAYFSQFGPLNQVIIDLSWQKAILIYADYESAARAWNDSRPVFNNRFVRIWWKKTDTMEKQNHNQNGPPAKELSGAVVDEVELEVAREAAKRAQKEHEEKQRRKQELEKKREELERQRLDLLDRQRVERERLMEKIKRAEEKAKDKAREVVESASNERKNTNNGSSENPMERKSETPVVQSPAPTHENGINGREQEKTVDETISAEESSRKAQLQKMLADLQDQVLSSVISIDF